ncbi:Neurofilament medium polypeptide, partial [Ophiophagus hannah]
MASCPETLVEEGRRREGEIEDEKERKKEVEKRRKKGKKKGGREKERRESKMEGGKESERKGGRKRERKREMDEKKENTGENVSLILFEMRAPWWFSGRRFLPSPDAPGNHQALTPLRTPQKQKCLAPIGSPSSLAKGTPEGPRSFQPERQQVPKGAATRPPASPHQRPQRLFISPGCAVKICRCRKVIGIDFSLAADPGGVLWGPRELPSSGEGGSGQERPPPSRLSDSKFSEGSQDLARRDPNLGEGSPLTWGDTPSPQRRRAAIKTGCEICPHPWASPKSTKQTLCPSKTPFLKQRRISCIHLPPKA